MRSTMGKNMLKGVWVFLALVGLVVAPTLISSGQGTITVVQKPGDKVLDEYDVFTIHMLMSRSLESLEQHISHDWSYIPNHEGASSSLLTLQRKLEEQDVLETLIVLDTLPELLDDDLIWRAVLKAWTTLEDEEELLETHFGKKTSQNKHVVLTKGAFQSFLTQLRGEPSESDEVQTSASKLVIMDGEPQLLKLQELRVLFEAYVQTTLLYQEQQSKQKPPGRSSRKSGSHIREAAATDSKVVLTKDAFRCLLKQVKLDTLQDEDHESSRSVDQEVSASKVAVSEGRNTSPLMLQKEFLIKLVSQTMSTIYSQSALQDQLKFLGELLDYDLLESLEEPESPSKLITPLMYQRAFFSKELLQTVNTVYGELGLQEKLKMWDAILDLAFQEHLEKTDSPSKLISPMMFLSKILLPTMSTLYGESGLHGQVKFQGGELNQNLPESVEETEPLNKLITPVMHQREFLSKELFQIMSKRYGESI
ncbi:uncharacterized protein [Haliotis asinina]|uniref:uncharacterized protein n=1 Tax=Haliotis asinina TaxID=109174 RepID=UPI003531CB0D